MYNSGIYKSQIKTTLNKKIILSLLFIILIGICITGNVSAMTGSGTESDPYMIYDSDDLQSMKDYLGSSTGFYFKLNNDIDCSDKTDWTPIGEYSSAPTFNNHLDGDGNTIKNWTFLSYNDYSGIFGCVTSGFSITNCTFDNIKHTSNQSYIGIICSIIYKASKEVKFTDIILKNSICSCVTGNYYAGGFVSRIEASNVTFNNCKCMDVNIIAYVGDASAFTSYFVASSTVTYKKCEINNCVIKTTTGGSVGGFIGYINGSPNTVDFDNTCICKNSIIQGRTGRVGGFVGDVGESTINISKNSTQNNGCKVINCYIYAGSDVVGGFIGHAVANYMSCRLDGVVVNLCTITNNRTDISSYVGGIIGSGTYSNAMIINNPTVKNCVIIGKSDKTSGIVGGYGWLP